MGMNLGAYIKEAEKRCTFAPDMEDIRASYPVRLILNKVLGVDFSKADTEHFSWEGEKLQEALFKLQADAAPVLLNHGGDISIEIYKEVVDFFRQCLIKDYIVSLV